VQRYATVLLDLDGTLTDSAPGILASIAHAMDSMGISMPPDDVTRTFLGPPLVDTFSGHFGLNDADVSLAIDRYRERYHDVGLFENEVYPGIPELLERLVDDGMTLGVATAKPTYSATRILEHFDLASRFTFIGGAELDGSRQHKNDVIAHTLVELEALGASTSAGTVVMVGDREHDVRGALHHDVPCVGVLWGYGTREELTAAGAIALVEDPAELAGQLTR